MGRRATYQFGMLLPWSEQGHVDQGLEKGYPLDIGKVPQLKLLKLVRTNS